jgi:hypothetical protein
VSNVSSNSHPNHPLLDTPLTSSDSSDTRTVEL